jgi:hypothetical protein
MSAIKPDMIDKTLKRPKAVKIILKPENKYMAKDITIKQIAQDQYSIEINKLKRNNKTMHHMKNDGPIIGVKLPATLKQMLQ